MLFFVLPQYQMNACGREYNSMAKNCSEDNIIIVHIREL